MTLVTALTGDPAVRAAIRGSLRDHQRVAGTRTWERCLSLIRERPATAVVVDSAALDDDQSPAVVLGELGRRFSSVGIVLVHRPELDPLELFRLGQVGLPHLALVRVEGIHSTLDQALAEVRTRGTLGHVLRAIGPRLARRERVAVRLALQGVQLGWCADELAAECGLTRAHLSVLLRARGLPPVGKLLLWARLLHAARWLQDAGRSAESISRQLEYSSGAAFRRTMRNHLGTTPSEVRERGGLRFVLGRFLDLCGLTPTVDTGQHAA